MPSILDTAFAKQTLLACTGYLPGFIDTSTRVNFEKIVSGTSKNLLPDVEGNNKKVLNYTNLSVLYNGERRVPFVSAYNIDGASKNKVKRANAFKADPRVQTEIQLSQKGFYDLVVGQTEFEIGHMAANNEMAWGTDAQLKSYQTFHFTNSVPQAENLNTGIWKTLETYIINEAATVKSNKRICVFTGPMLRTDDPGYVNDSKFKVPLLFYKVVVFMTPKGVFSTAFMMSHEEKLKKDKLLVFQSSPTLATGDEQSNFDDFKFKKVFQVNIPFLEENTNLDFSWKGVKKIQVPNDKNQIVKIRKIKDSKDAAKAEKDLRSGVVPPTLALSEDLTDHEIKKQTYRLNIILP